MAAKLWGHSPAGIYGYRLRYMAGAAARSANLRGQTHVQRCMRPLLERVQRRKIGPSFVITHRLGLDEAADGYKDVSRQRKYVRQGRHASVA